MKIAATIFLSLSIAGGGFFVLIALFALGIGVSTPETVFSAFLFGTIYGSVGAVPLAFSIVGLVKLNKARCADDISVAWKIIIILIFASKIAGILLLCMRDEDFAPAGRPRINEASVSDVHPNA